MAAVVSFTIEDPREIDEPCESRRQRDQEQAVQPIEPRHLAFVASKSMTTVSARPIRALAGSACSGPGCVTPSALLTAGGMGFPSTDVPHRLTSWMKNRPPGSTRRRRCSRDTLELPETCTSTHAELPPRPIETVSFRMRNTCGPCSSSYVRRARSRLSRASLISALRARISALRAGSTLVAPGVAAGGAAAGSASLVVLVAVRRPPPTTLLTMRVVGVPAYSAGAG